MFLNFKRTSFGARSSKRYKNTENNEDHSLHNGEDSRRKKDKKKKDKISRSGSDTNNPDSVRGRLKLLILGRPPLETLQEKGIIKENVFGCPLEKLCAKENTTIPKFVKLCVEEVEKRGLNIDGIYRVSGSMSSIMKLRYMVDRDEEINLSSPQWSEIHIITGALKMFLRELPEPVLPFRFFNQFITTCQKRDYNDRISSIKSLIQSLPLVNLNTLRYLIEHFRRVVSHKATNRMEAQNIGIVFGPTLLVKPPEESHLEVPGSGEMAVTMHFQNFLIETILSECQYMFS